ncbi:thiosulfate sulfurtransferase 16, chloroplastic-like isoform X1 [Corylus avellana]|uniref:thiosulfate sulfurtransferase 16, chloroplastic-like isoform X1 n=1 Tax=Corylus avellana TaxID=13451 RepID=UPI00286B87C8|nr:thiosulfate sulfurtransferase 16, chloroplastic-like isoform X1 [Corylus avellana]
MAVKPFVSSACFTGFSVPTVFYPPDLNQSCRCLLSSMANPQRCRIGSKRKVSNLRIPNSSLRGNLEATGVPTSVPVRVAHELFQAGHRYLDVRTPEEFSAGHASGAINIPYMYRVGSGMVKNPNFLAEVSAHFGKYDEIIVGCQLGKRSLMAATDLLAAGFSGITDIAGGYAAWTQNGLPTEM